MDTTKEKPIIAMNWGPSRVTYFMGGILSIAMVAALATDFEQWSGWRPYYLFALITLFAIVCCWNGYRDFRLPLMRVLGGKFEWREPDASAFQEFALGNVTSCRMESGDDLRIGLRTGEEIAISLKAVDEEVRPAIIAALKSAANAA
ncbi:MAG: hypothetical protein GY930_12920 [bacterium]|nr:hypothetical protein [bacterium]